MLVRDTEYNTMNASYERLSENVLYPYVIASLISRLSAMADSPHHLPAWLFGTAINTFAFQ